MSVIVIKNAEKVITSLDPPVLQDGADIVITNDIVTAIGRNTGDEAIADKVIDASGCIVHPGLVCSHHHYYSGLSRGITANIGPTPDFISTLQELWWRIDRALDEESVYYSSMICSLDAIRSGTTAVIDHHSSPSYITGSLDAIKKGFVETGLRGMTCYEVTNRNGGDAEIEKGVEENVRFAKSIDVEKSSGKISYLVEAAIGGHAPFTISDTGLGLLAEAVEETGRGIHLHIAEDLYDVSVSHHLYRKDLVLRLHDYGLINERSILVHGLFLSNEDVEILNQQDGFLVHNARSNMNNNVGYNKMLPSVKNLALGTDGIGADMFEELKFAYFKNRDAGGRFWPPKYLSALSNGNKILERYFSESIGNLEPGYKADLVISDYLSPTPLNDENLAGHFAFGMGSSSVKTVIINGKIVLENREFPFDAGQIYRDAAKHAERVWERMNTGENIT
ncbi:MAG: putative aminohydrolase SsnA [Spirochaetales bacterium]|nr:putative aminohydrolase SsnA [Spirochaetales bacterium]